MGFLAKDYETVFGKFEPIRPDEVIIDVGSGDSRLTSLVPDGKLIQIDPKYSDDPTPLRLPSSREELPHNLKVPIALGLGKATWKIVNQMHDYQADRVTMSQALHLLSGKNRIVALEQVLFMADSGIAQIFPFYKLYADKVVEDGEELGFEVSADKISIRSIGMLQSFYGKLSHGPGYNNTLTVNGQSNSIKRSDRKRLATLINANHPFLENRTLQYPATD